jgi:predicted transcriptional regulator
MGGTEEREMVTKRQELKKQEIMKSLERLPDDANLGDFLDHLTYLYGIEQGLADDEAGRTISHEELLEQIARWTARDATEPATERGGARTAKEAVIRSLARLPEDATAEDINYRVYVVLNVERALSEAAAGNKVSQQARERLKRWLK